jgi:hypothetical protein
VATLKTLIFDFSNILKIGSDVNLFQQYANPCFQNRYKYGHAKNHHSSRDARYHLFRLPCHLSGPHKSAWRILYVALGRLWTAQRLIDLGSAPGSCFDEQQSVDTSGFTGGSRLTMTKYCFN